MDKMTLDEWIIKGSVGVSSKTMWACLKDIDIPHNHGDIPYDPDDFSRCYKLYKSCELSKEDLDQIKTKLPYWEPYIDNWERLCEMYENNVNTNWKNYKEIGMYELMEELLKISRKIRYCND